jgi:hypothetical protein
MKRKSKKYKLIGSLFLLILFFSLTNLSSIATEETYHNHLNIDETEISLFFTGPFRSFGLPIVSYAVWNKGDVTAKDVSCTFTIKGGFDDSIDFTHSTDWGDISPEYSTGTALVNYVNGFGPVTISAIATCSNAEDNTKNCKGFQLFHYTFIFG